ncbi:molybdate ABC transporter substrate-binding protein [Pontiellaceae bacterium B1224]|nr:molybdate ABC transporter substrate-binding protein [Pontiellaceae bacterium B1224]
MKTIKILIFISLGLTASYAEDGNTLRIFAAAGTTPAMKEIAQQYTRKTGTAIVFNFANSGILARQINAGAEFDLFFSANEKWMDYVEEKALIEPSTRITLLENEMVIVVPKGHSPDFDLSAPDVERFAVGDQATPIGIYAKQAFTQLGCWDSLQPHLCVGDTVNKVLNYVALGEADAGAVFRSVAHCASNQVDMACIVPAALHSPIRFPIAAAQRSPERMAFIAYLQSQPAQNLFNKYGWTPCKIEK